MKIVRIIGGLGNQMFQYALYLSLRKRFPKEKILVDCSLFRSYGVHNGLELDKVFGVDLPQASFFEMFKVTVPTYNYTLARIVRKILPKRVSECYEAKDYTYNEHVFSPGNRYYNGYWQNFRYFIDIRELIQNTYKFSLPHDNKNSEILRELSESQSSVSIHVRRGDYLKAPNYAGLCGLEYYRQAINYIKKQIKSPSFYIFSDDIGWCKENIMPMLEDAPVNIVDWNRGSDSYRDIQIMSACKNNIIANSSFSWWAAFLNTNKNAIVCAPAKWTNTIVNCKFQLPEWVLF
ncbi:alpha-1,2-fucosyltransferase [Muribaculum intestinale]|uniref:alpha-1,2-fucosyltransferase n=1 Tax=Muribaculum intestinale TaxID=1796646 RepID=UPI00242E7B0D|nr:alpha-1,2-fucosyltransferase [Muribaculum intestinale]